MRSLALVAMSAVLLAVGTAAAEDTPQEKPPTADATPKQEKDGAGGAPATPAPAKPTETPAVSVPVVMNPNCPIMGKPASALLFTDTDHGRIYLCCAPCARKVKKDPDRAYEAAFPTAKKAGNTVCPVTGEKVDAKSPTVLLQGVEVSVANEDAKKLVPTMAQLVLAKALDSTLRDVSNANCPITGKPVAANAFCLVGKDIVRLSGAECVEEVRKDPTRALAAAREDAAKAKAKLAPKEEPAPAAPAPEEKAK